MVESICPCVVVPVICGKPVLTGALATAEVCADVADALPLALEAVTITWIVKPTSDSASAYVLAVAPAMSVQDVGVLQSCHWYM